LKGLPDLILLDLMMPGLNGYDTCKGLRTIGDHKRLPIIILTGLDDIKSIEKAFESGSTDFITKPLNWPLLTQRVRYALRTRELFKELENTQKRLSRAHSMARIGYWELDIDSGIVTLFDETKFLLGLSKNNFTLDELLFYIDKTENDKIRTSIKKALESGIPYTLDHSFSNQHGVKLMLRQQGEITERNGNKIINGTLQDITERKQAEEKIHFHRFYDQETSLPNKDHLQMQLDNIIERNSHDELTAIVSLSFDKVRNIGSTIGQDFINQFLKKSAERILTNIPYIHEISRISTTTFGFLINNIKAVNQIDRICNQLISLFRESICIDDHEYHSTLSIGLTIYPDDKETTNLLNNANTALKLCIAKGGSKFLFYSKEMNDHTKEQIILEDSMRVALDNNEFIAFFQPQINTIDDQITGMEALARWITADNKIIPPDKFIPIAEEAELIIELGKEILYQSCQFTKSLQQQGLGQIRVGVNLSAVQFADKNLLTTIKNTLADIELDPSQLEIEITEGTAMTDIDHAIKTLSQIREMGIKTSMDDFGTGYSSLSYLQKLPLDTLKIDQSFIRPIGVNGENSEIARAIIAMGHSL
ncbi:MAG: EAL domain-containing protein, partial [Gammaproteobacteria bacterium]|nr:EAL domain-containing protein [Gammaproteobacteria bacterium]